MDKLFFNCITFIIIQFCLNPRGHKDVKYIFYLNSFFYNKLCVSLYRKCYVKRWQKTENRHTERYIVLESLLDSPPRCLPCVLGNPVKIWQWLKMTVLEVIEQCHNRITGKYKERVYRCNVISVIASLFSLVFFASHPFLIFCWQRSQYHLHHSFKTALQP